MAHNGFTTDLPEFARMANDKLEDCPDLSTKDFWDARARGPGGSDADPLCSVVEENMPGYDPAKAPTFVWPERLQKPSAKIKAQAQAQDKAA